MIIIAILLILFGVCKLYLIYNSIDYIKSYPLPNTDVPRHTIINTLISILVLDAILCIFGGIFLIQ